MPGANHPGLTTLLARVAWLEAGLKRKDQIIAGLKNRPPVIAPAPLASIPGTMIAPAFAAQIAVDRFVDHLPYYRQSNRFEGTIQCDGYSAYRAIAAHLHELIVEARTATLPHGKFGEALTYAINQWEKFLVCLQQGTLEVDTNLVENLIRPTKLGAKNSMFFGSLEAGTNNALFYTLMANCKSHGLDPEMYLTEVIKRLPHNATVEQAATLTPARFAAELRAKQQVA